MTIGRNSSLKFASIIILGLMATSGLAKPREGNFTPVSTGSGIMTKSQSVASGMSMRTKTSPQDQYSMLGSHPIIALRKDQSDVEFDLGLGTWTSKIKSSTSEIDSEASFMHVGLGTTIVTTSGIRFGAHAEIGDDPIKVKVKKPIKITSKVKLSMQDISFFAAAGLTQNFGVALNMIMADRKVGDDSESGTVMSPGIMAMFDTTEVIFDLVQRNEDLGITGHWRLSLVHELNSSSYLTGEMVRLQPDAGDDYWRFIAGMRKRTSRLSSLGGELFYNQQHNSDSDKCITPTLVGFQGDMDQEISTTQTVSFGAHFDTGKCSNDGKDKTNTSITFKGGFGVVF